MSTTNVTTESWVNRLGKSFLGIGVGFFLIIFMAGLLWWNEGRAVQTQRSLAEGSGLVVPLPTDSVDPLHEGSLIHLSGPLASGEFLSDESFLVTAQGVRLVRNVEMFQWIESSSTERQQNLGGSETRTTTYTYAPGWSERHHDSSQFQDAASHYNPPLQHSGQSFRLESAGLGSFSLDRNVLDRVTGAERLDLPVEFIEPLQERFGENVSIADGAVYLGPDPAQPQIGDHRISFELVPLGNISVVGQQRGNGVSFYSTEAGDSLLLVSQGNATAEEMFDTAASGNALLTWLFRVGGLLMLITGFSLLLRPLSVLASVVPFAGRLVGMGTGLVAAILGVAVGTLTIGLAWIAFRPVVAIIIFALGAALILVIRQQIKRRKPAPSIDAAVA